MIRSSIASVTRHIPPGQLGRYLVVGIWNTAFGYGTFALLTALLDRYIPASYLAASLLSSVLNITVSFLGYKWFVFKTKGNYLKEWARCLMVYSGSIVLGLALLPPTVFLVIYVGGNPSASPYIAGALIMALQVIISFVGHKRFSFQQSGEERSGECDFSEISSATFAELKSTQFARSKDEENSRAIGNADRMTTGDLICRSEPSDKAMDRAYCAMITVIWIAMIAAANPIGDFPLNDDWVYGLVVRSLLETGHYHFPSSASANLGPQAYWGALFCVPFGFSFTALRFSTLTLGLVGSIGQFYLVKELGETRRTAMLGALVLIVNPLYFGLANSFMTDVPFTSTVIISLYFFVRGFKRDSVASLGVGLLFAFAAILIRQLGLVVLIGFSAAYVLKFGARPTKLLTALLVPFAGAVLHFGYQEWLVSSGRMGALSLHADVANTQLPSLWVARLTLVVTLTYVGFFLFPFIVSFYRERLHESPGQTRGTYALTSFAILLFALLWWQGLLMPSSENVLTKYGLGPLTLRDTFILGLNTPSIPPIVELFWIAATAIGVIGGVALIYRLSWVGYRTLFNADAGKSRLEPWVVAIILLAPAAYLVILLVASARVRVFDRYLVVFVPFCVLLFSSFANRGLKARANPTAAIIMLAAYAALSVAATHDYLSWNRTRWIALGSLLANTTVQASSIDGGYEFNGWYLSNTKHVRTNEKSWWWVVDDKYMVTSGPVPGYVELHRYSFRRWFLGEDSNVFVLQRAF